MKLITETNYEEIGLLKETSGDGVSKLYIEGIFAQAEQKNRNGRIYPNSVLKREVEKFVKEKVESGRALGELEHPDSPSIDPKNASHRITELKEDGNNWTGKALILDKTPAGQIALGLLEGGTTLGVSTRGMGTVSQKNGYVQVNENFKLVTVDIVTDPSGPDCFVNGIMEGVEWVVDDKGIFKQSNRQRIFKQSRKILETVSDTQKIRMIGEFLSKL